jgi:predicted metal-dependent HD superfamily phosphohydrolase
MFGRSRAASAGCLCRAAPSLSRRAPPRRLPVAARPSPGLAGADRRLLRWAILWHDAIYDPTRTDNEERSAELAFDELTACGVDDSTAGEVARLILLTSGHRAQTNDHLGALLVSIDLSILGSDANRYREYVDGVRQEYSHVPEGNWRQGRAAVLKHLLGSEPLYPDPRFRAAFEAQARRNVEEEIKSLAAS